MFEISYNKADDWTRTWSSSLLTTDPLISPPINQIEIKVSSHTFGFQIVAMDLLPLKRRYYAGYQVQVVVCLATGP
jgi:hypothetical protein